MFIGAQATIAVALFTQILFQISLDATDAISFFSFYCSLALREVEKKKSKITKRARYRTPEILDAATNTIHHAARIVFRNAMLTSMAF
ncbi:hypothetical protein MKZ38_005688 [Zalerion maritima]|uniref:Uncharacterized protein n=1 Tax=Zalerion maritima TaxID=339359 RepID=A0AAD5RJW8_9PEZI|nr:hypothetical protein MKZ38_005688 [Zalerion maritima]